MNYYARPETIVRQHCISTPHYIQTLCIISTALKYINCFAMYQLLFCNISTLLQRISCSAINQLFCNISTELQYTAVLKYINNFSKLPHNTSTCHRNINSSDINAPFYYINFSTIYQLLCNISTIYSALLFFSLQMLFFDSPNFIQNDHLFTLQKMLELQVHITNPHLSNAPAIDWFVVHQPLLFRVQFIIERHQKL